MATPLLALDSVTKEFGKIRAVDEVSLEIPVDEVTAVIGPNGAGKTTLFNLITGRYELTSGQIKLRGDRINGLEPQEIVQRGLARSFQITNFFPDLTALENVRLAAQAQNMELTPGALLSHHDQKSESKDAARAVLDRLDLLDIAQEPANSLSHGQQRHLEICIALACNPDVLVMDEPTAGMSPEETVETRELVEDLAEDITIVIIEHDMDVVMRVADRLAVMENGSLLTVGPPETVREDERVQQAYLGGETV
ncbi:ABC transporter ATP-binding protein [Haloarcula sp. 1CSR25-25]|jgi:branched-chain amino acid transport system ATP-binding protein|uniref:ABC transporter ATP-binding protein n=1 Tax=Haloarcula sp. 1CSR25-25 TaxID=2862545 RepID=UPI002895D819|nr:ABC transporter ATP-binding protein [Haloarcula sp. 1CSR25-25]MDT3437755.1 ABC transporter ATP-binding protein [Haloarcula sp. 1CSR25-25]